MKTVELLWEELFNGMNMFSCKEILFGEQMITKVHGHFSTLNHVCILWQITWRCLTVAEDVPGVLS